MMYMGREVSEWFDKFVDCVIEINATWSALSKQRIRPTPGVSLSAAVESALKKRKEDSK